MPGVVKVLSGEDLDPRNNLADLGDASVAYANLTGNSAAVDVTIAIAAGAANVNAATITVTDANGATVAGVHALTVWLSEAATGIGLSADSYSGGLAATTGTILTEHVADKCALVLTAATGIAVLTLTDTAKPADQYWVVQKPVGGDLVVSAATGALWGA